MWDSNGGKDGAWEAELKDCRLGFGVGEYEGAVGGAGTGSGF